MLLEELDTTRWKRVHWDISTPCNCFLSLIITKATGYLLFKLHYFIYYYTKRQLIFIVVFFTVFLFFFCMFTRGERSWKEIYNWMEWKKKGKKTRRGNQPRCSRTTQCTWAKATTCRQHCAPTCQPIHGWHPSWGEPFRNKHWPIQQCHGLRGDRPWGIWEQ